MKKMNLSKYIIERSINFFLINLFGLRAAPQGILYFRFLHYRHKYKLAIMNTYTVNESAQR
jgi:hypothetical protein